MTKYRLIVCLTFLALSLGVKAQTAELQKMSPMVRAKYLQSRSQLSRPQQLQHNKVKHPLYLFVKTTDDTSDLYAENGCDVLATFADIQIVSIPQTNLYNIAHDKRVTRLEMGHQNHLTNAASSEILNAIQVHEGLNLPQAYTGKGVIVGVQDVGFDLTNPNFYSRDMTEYRIKALWDMLSADTLGSTLPVGNDYRDEPSLLAYAHSRDGLSECHGSHTLGSAAGSGYNSAYAGIAYDSDICLVSNIIDSNVDYLPEDFDEDAYSTPLSALGFKYIFDYADTVGKPCVISFSEGSFQSFTDDDLLYYDVLSQMVTKGHLIVASAGNNSTEETYFRKPRGRERAGTFAYKYGTQLYFMAQGTDDFTTRLTIYASEKTTLDIETAVLRQDIDSIFSTILTIDGTDYEFLYVAYPSCYDENNIVIECLITGPDRIGYTDVAPISIETRGEEADVEVFSLIGLFTSNNSLDPELCDSEASHNIVSPGSAPSVICVGATAYSTGYVNIFGDTKTYDYGTAGVVSTFSSIGPTLDGRMKPDVMAPGTNIISSTNSYYFAANPEASQWSDLIASYDFDGRTYYWKADTGTSMSTPLVAGAIALWLEANPNLSYDEVMEIFAATCSHPDTSLSYPNNIYGYGQIDIYRGLLSVLQLDGIKDISPSQAKNVHISAVGGHSLVVTFDSPLSRKAEIKIFSLSGQLIKTTSLPAAATSVTIPLQQSASRVVVVQVNGDSPLTTGSTLLRI